MTFFDSKAERRPKVDSKLIDRLTLARSKVGRRLTKGSLDEVSEESSQAPRK